MSEEVSFQRGSHKIFANLYGQSSQGVLLCPPHLKYGGSQEDSRLAAIANELADSGISALCMDYSVHTGGNEEVNTSMLQTRLRDSHIDQAHQLWYRLGVDNIA